MLLSRLTVCSRLFQKSTVISRGTSSLANILTAFLLTTGLIAASLSVACAASAHPKVPQGTPAHPQFPTGLPYPRTTVALNAKGPRILPSAMMSPSNGNKDVFHEALCRTLWDEGGQLAAPVTANRVAAWKAELNNGANVFADSIANIDLPRNDLRSNPQLRKAWLHIWLGE